MMSEGQSRHRSSSITRVIHARRVSVFWILVPTRWRMRMLMWRPMRKVEREFRAKHFPLLTAKSSKRVAKVLRTEWDHTGVRLLGVPKGDYVVFAKQLIMTVPGQKGVRPQDVSIVMIDQVLAAGLASLEAQLGLRDSPLEHRMKVAAHIRACLDIPSNDTST